jgi:HTH-type transcriptional regulator/antitoxin HigA
MELVEKRGYRGLPHLSEMSQMTFLPEEAAKNYSDARVEKRRLAVKAARWHTFEEVRSIFKHADKVHAVPNDCVIFNVRGNRYRLITVIHYAINAGRKEDQRERLYRVFFDAQRIRQSGQLGQKIRDEEEKMSTVLANPAKMISKGAPHIIHNDEELEVYTEALFKLTALKNPTSDEEEAIELLGLLVERYEDEHWPITTDVDRVSMVRYLMEQGDIKQKDLIPEFGPETAVSLFLSGQRNLTVEQIRKLSARFKLDASIFISAAGAGA